MSYKLKSRKDEKQFNDVLKSAKRALDSINIPFHLHAGTSLGAYREKSFIAHDHDIDLAVFSHDVNTYYKVKKLIIAMEAEGFVVRTELGKLSRGKEIQFRKNDVPLDIFWVYPGKYRGKDYFLVASYYGECDDLKYKTCVWGYSPYKTQNISFLGETYSCVPQKTLVDMYGKDWNKVKQFGYYEGIKEGGYKGFLKDYYNPKKTDNKIAFCFLLYDVVKHQKSWETFFNQDRYPVKSYTIYSHVKKVTDKTPDWIKRNKVKTAPTDWCGKGLVYAWINMLREAYKNPDNKYFCLLSGECIPLFTFLETHKKINRSKKSIVHIDYDAEVYVESKADGNPIYYADQWVTLNRHCAKLLIDLVDTEQGKNFTEDLDMCRQDYCSCPDELWPVNWFIHKLGKPSSSNFKKYIKTHQSTYTYWDPKSSKPHPIKFTTPKMNKMKKQICESRAVFGRKFNNKAARELALNC